jgi:hypothetical protein
MTQSNGSTTQLAAATCRDTAEDIRHRLTSLRQAVLSLEQARPIGPAARFEALLMGYDIYSHMLYDALTGMAATLADAA